MIKKILSFCLVGLSLAVTASEPLVFKHMTVFGDSLSDNGNLYNLSMHMVPKSPPYSNGRFTNGPVWFENVKKTYWGNNKPALTKDVSDYAVGGAGAILSEKEILPYTLWTELSDYIVRDSGVNIDSTLFVVWIGANNYLQGPENVEELTTDVVAGIKKGVHRLLKHGASMIVIGNLPDLGETPESAENNVKDITHKLTIVHNEKLYAMYQQLQQEHPNVHFVYMDVYKLFNEALTAPSAFGLTDTKNPCYDGGFFLSSQLRGLVNNSPSTKKHVSNRALKSYLLKKAKAEGNSFSEKTADQFLKNTALREAILNGYYAANKNPLMMTAEDSDTTCPGYLFWDHIHPTTHVHKYISQLFIDSVKEAGIEPSPFGN